MLYVYCWTNATKTWPYGLYYDDWVIFNFILYAFRNILETYWGWGGGSIRLALWKLYFSSPLNYISKYKCIMIRIFRFLPRLSFISIKIGSGSWLFKNRKRILNARIRISSLNHGCCSGWNWSGSDPREISRFRLDRQEKSNQVK